MQKAGERFYGVKTHFKSVLKSAKIEGICWSAAATPHYFNYSSVINQSEDYLVTVDGRIDNESEIITSTEQDFNEPAGVVKSYFIKNGPMALMDIIGDFCISICDVRNNTLYLYRSCFGIRPLVYFWIKGHYRTAWASSLEQVLQISETTVDISEEYLAIYLSSTSMNNQKATPYNNIYHLLPGECLKISVDRIERLFCRSPQYSEETYNLSYKMQLEIFRDLFFEAVRCRLRRSSSEIHISLSGGLDSSSIACVATQIIKNENVPVTLSCDHLAHIGEGNESKFAALVAEHIGCSLNMYSDNNYSDILEAVKLSQPTPFYAPSRALLGNLTINAINDKAENWVRFTGHGGDQVTSSSRYLYPIGLIQRKKYYDAYQELRNISKSGNSNMYRVFMNNIVNMYRQKDELWGTSFSIDHHLLTDEFISKWALRERKYHKSITKEYPFDVQLRFEQLLHGSSWMSEDGSHLLSNRYPFLDIRLVDFCLSVPEFLKRDRNDRTKTILKEGLKDVLPQIIRRRNSKSSHFGSFVNGMASRGDVLVDIVKKSKLIERGVIRKEKYKELLGYMQYGSLTHQVPSFLSILALDVWLIMRENGYAHNELVNKASQ